MDRFYSNLEKRFFLYQNRKIKTPNLLYLSFSIPLILSGICLAVGVVVLTVHSIGWIYILFSVLLVWLSYRADKKGGYLIAIHKRYLEKLEEVRKDLEESK